MATTNLIEWLAAVRADLNELSKQDFGYPIGKNEVREPVTVLPDSLPAQLSEIYGAFDGLSLPDVHVGYFINTASRATSAAQRGEPTVIEASRIDQIHVFGSDGGGGRFAISVSDGCVYYLPSSGAVKDGKYIENSASPVTRIAASVSDFLDRLREDVRAFVRGSCEHKYMAN